MKRINLKIIIFVLGLGFPNLAHKDLTIFGPLIFADGIGRVGLGIAECLKRKISIQCDPCGILGNDVAQIKNLIFLHLETSDVALVTDPLYHFPTEANIQKLKKSKIKIAYSMLECSAIPEFWTNTLNELFDAVVVPDEYLRGVYESSGVSIPVFVLPCPSYLDEFLTMPLKKKPNNPFVFGSSGTFIDRKNQFLIVQAFRELFGNNNDVKLVLHGRVAPWNKDNNPLQKIYAEIQQFGLKNVEIIQNTFSRKKYVDLIASMDCYIFISKGEGFSFTPREALAMGLPCILSNNTVHTSIIDTGLVIPIPCKKMVPAQYPFFEISNAYFFDCDIEDVKKSMLAVYENYSNYIEDAQKRRKWAKQYLPRSLAKKFYTLVKPSKVILGPENRIDNDVIITNDPTLITKYNLLGEN